MLAAVEPDAREAILAAHPNRAAIERDLSPQKLQRYVVITRAVVNGEMAGCTGTRNFAIYDLATYQKLEAAGCEMLQWKGSRDDHDPAGWLAD
ncbi:MAG: hypothetical protein ABJE66_05950 [Deltaproteobacteria bacterium]